MKYILITIILLTSLVSAKNIKSKEACMQSVLSTKYEHYTWKLSYGDWSCSSYQNFMGGGVPNKVSVYADSKKKNIITNYIEIRADIFKVQSKATLKKELVKVLKLFFKNTKLKAPKNLYTNIKNEKNMTKKMQYGNVILTIDHSYNMGYGINVRIKI